MNGYKTVTFDTHTKNQVNSFNVSVFFQTDEYQVFLGGGAYNVQSLKCTERKILYLLLFVSASVYVSVYLCVYTCVHF